MSLDKRANHLIKEKNPYLLQHAYNPVDWYSWWLALNYNYERR